MRDEPDLAESLPELGLPPEQAALLQTEQLERAMYAGGAVVAHQPDMVLQYLHAQMRAQSK